MAGFYNGYSGSERASKYNALKKLWKQGVFPCTGRSCDLCGDPEPPNNPHSEDYSYPYLWEPPAMYALCRSCHLWIHKRFKQPLDWLAFKYHVRRGGYGREFSSPAVRKERKQFINAFQKDENYKWSTIPDREFRNGYDWWEHLTLSPESLEAKWARSRK